jgi:rubrerythrin
MWILIQEKSIMATKGRQISAKDVLKDIEDGMSNADLMKKYNLSEKGIQSLYDKLYAKKALRIGADSVILSTPVDGLAKKLELYARKPKAEATDPGSGRKKSRQTGVPRVKWTCQTCGKRFSREFDHCPSCGVEAEARPHLRTIERKKQESVSTGEQTYKEPEKTEDAHVSPPKGAGIDLKTVLGGLGALFLVFGTLAPIIKVPIMGGLNYFQIGKVAHGMSAGGFALMGLAAASVALMVVRRPVWLWLTGLSSVAVLAYTFYQYPRTVRHLAARMEQMQLKMGNGSVVSPGSLESPNVAGNVADQFAGMFQDFSSLDWGWLVLILGTALLLVCAFLGAKDRPMGNENTA